MYIVQCLFITDLLFSDSTINFIFIIKDIFYIIPNL